MMITKQKEFNVKELNYRIRSAVIKDAKTLSELRIQIDGETENMDRESGEAFIDASGFEIEGVLKHDKLLADGRFYNTIVMGRFRTE